MAMKVFTVTDGAAAADVNEYMVNTKYAAKPSGTIRSNTATTAIDPDLQLQVDTNKSYMIEVFLLFNSSVTANFKYRFNAPAGAVLYGSVLAYYVGGTGPGITGYHTAGSNAVLYNTPQSIAGQDPFNSPVRISGVLNTAGTGGGFSVAWSQDTSNGFSTQLLSGSFMLVRRVA